MCIYIYIYIYVYVGLRARLPRADAAPAGGDHSGDPGAT